MPKELNLDEISANELLASVHGDDEQTIAAQSTSKPPKKEEAPETSPETSPDTSKGEKTVEELAAEAATTEEIVPLSQEDFSTVSNEVSETLRSFTDDASDETKAIKQDMLSLFKGATDFDNEGNLIDAEGKQIATYDDLVNKVGGEEDANFDEAGNQVDAEGKVITTKHQLDVNDSDVNGIGKDLGYEFDDGKGGIKLYGEGNEGLKELTDDIANHKLQEFQNEFFNSNPVLREVSKHLLAGGQLEDFQKPIDYTNVDIKDMTLDNKKAIIKQSYLAEGMSESRAEKLITGLEDGEDTSKEVQESLDVLQGKQEERETGRQAALDAQVAQQAEDNKTYWGEVDSAISKGDLDGFNIPDTDRKDFFNYLAIPVKDGQSQDMIDRGSRNLEQELKEAFYRFKKYDVSNVVKEEVSRNNLRSIRQRIQKSKEMTQSQKPHIKGGATEISLDNII